MQTPDGPRIAFFRENLFAWAAHNPRPMPWKGERDPYKIWLSEIILQQTRVEQGLPYYLRFVERYPTVRDLADAPEDELMKLWEGLGYYSRARNLHAAAKHIAYELNGLFPNTYEQIKALKGVGDYTAAAVASFGFGLPHAVLDGNVYRVLARFLGIETPTDTPAAKREFSALAQALLDPDRPAAFNQAMMDFGAMCCTPQQPRCAACPLQSACRALNLGRVGDLPLKSKTLTKKERFFVYLIFSHAGDVFVRKRTEKDIWQGLWEFPMVEQAGIEAGEDWVRLAQGFFPEKPLEGLVLRNVSPPFRQALTHQLVTAVFCEIDLPDAAEAVFQSIPFREWHRAPRESMKKNIAFPRIVERYLQTNALTLRF
jgi:A/G-specific adenine glycosylase